LRSDARPVERIRLLFIHHSCGGQLLAEPGPDRELDPCIYLSHPNGGGLRRRLESGGFEVHEASYGSGIGENTDLFDWLPKFRDQLDRILAVDSNDRLYPDGRRNQVVVWKSCFPNNLFRGVGHPPGDPRGPELTLWNAKASFSALLPHLARHPEVRFIYVTAPPVAQESRGDPRWKSLVKRLLGRPRASQSGAWAREFNGWISSPSGWRAGYSGQNVLVLDYYDILTGGGRSNFLCYPTQGGTDSHPSSEGNRLAADRFVELLEGIIPRPAHAVPEAP